MGSVNRRTMNGRRWAAWTMTVTVDLRLIRRLRLRRREIELAPALDEAWFEIGLRRLSHDRGDSARDLHVPLRQTMAAWQDRAVQQAVVAVVLALVAVGVAVLIQRRQRASSGARADRLPRPPAARPRRLRPAGCAVARGRVHLRHVRDVRGRRRQGPRAGVRRRRGRGGRVLGAPRRCTIATRSTACPRSWSPTPRASPRIASSARRHRHGSVGDGRRAPGAGLGPRRLRSPRIGARRQLRRYDGRRVRRRRGATGSAPGSSTSPLPSSRTGAVVATLAGDLPLRAELDEAEDLFAVDRLVLEQRAGDEVEPVAVRGRASRGSAPPARAGSARPPRR